MEEIYETPKQENPFQDLIGLLEVRDKWNEENRQMSEKWKADAEAREKKYANVLSKEEETVTRVKRKLLVDWDDKTFQQRVFDELEKSGFKRLSFLRDILDEWDLSLLTGYPALLAKSGLDLNRDTNEIQFYRDLFSQLEREKLLHFLAWCVAGEELDEEVIDKIVSTNED